MDETEFDALADATLAFLMDAVDEAIGDVADVELQGGILTIALEDGRQYVINKHAPNRQVWLSSPVSGASHFDRADGGWRSTRSEAMLHSLLAEELSSVSGTAVVLDEMA